MGIIAPVLNWAATNALISYNAEGEYTAQEFGAAETYYTQFTEALEQCSNAINTPLPSRHDMALEELNRVMPAGDYLTHKAYYHVDDPLGTPISFHELFMSGDLIAGGWTGNRISTRIKTSFEEQKFNYINPYIQKLENIQQLYKKTFDEYFAELQRGTATALKLALCELPEADRIRLEYGVLSFYTVRRKFSDHATQETQVLRDKHRGRYGVIICAEYASNRYYYELFTLRAACYPRQDLQQVFERTAIEYFEPTESLDKNQKQWQAQALDWPLDIDAYLKGTEPVKNVTHAVVVEKLWQIAETDQSLWKFCLGTDQSDGWCSWSHKKRRKAHQKWRSVSHRPSVQKFRKNHPATSLRKRNDRCVDRGKIAELRGRKDCAN